jgi:hypothetical protein
VVAVVEPVDEVELECAVVEDVEPEVVEDVEPEVVVGLTTLDDVVAAVVVVLPPSPAAEAGF